MGQTLIKVECVDQRLYVAASPAVASGGRNEDAVEFSFCPLWEGFEKTAVFYITETEPYHAPITDDRCIIPHEVLADEGTMFFGVFGVKDDITRTSEIVRYRVLKGAITEGTKPSSPTANIFAQIRDGKANALKATASGDAVAIWPDEGSLLKTVISFDPIQEGSGDPSPDNIRPITGRTSAKLTRCGKNLIDFTSMHVNNSNVLADYTENSIRIHSVAAGTYQRAELRNISLRSGVKYTISAELTDMTGGYARIGFIDQRDNTIHGSIVYSDVGKRTVTFSVPQDTIVYFAAWCSWGNAIVGDVTFVDIQVEIGEKATEYESYRGETFALDFGQTVYGGTLDWNSGTLTVDKATYILNGTETPTGFSALTNHARIRFDTIKDAPAITYVWGDKSGVCSHAPYHAVASNDMMNAYASKGQVYVSLPISVWGDTQDSCAAYLAAQYAAGTPVQICYKLATPATVQLDTQQILALEGLNSIYSDGSSVAVTYNKSLAKVVEELTNAIISLGGNV